MPELQGAFSDRVKKMRKTIYMKIIIISIFWTLLLSIPVFSQKKSSQTILLNKNELSVYLKFKRYMSISSKNAEESENLIILTLVNNTRWNIWLEMGGVSSKEYGEARLFYDVKTNKDELLKSKRCHVCSLSPLGSGNSLQFAIPLESLSENQKIQIQFRYEWQNKESWFAGDEVTNLVTFFSNNLPKVEN